MAILKAINISNLFASRKKMIPSTPHTIWKKPLHFIAFGFGSGAMPIAPGTFGTLMAIPFYLLFLQPLSLLHYCLFTLIFIIISCYICDRVSRDIQVYDHPGICLDEFAGFFIAMINAPQGFTWLLAGFILFRLFDILKPWPIYWLDQHLHGGIGIVLDDVFAGIYALVILQIVKILG